MTTLALRILTVLDRQGGLLMREDLLFAEVNLGLPRAVTMSELTRELNRLEGKKRVKSHRDEDDELKWKITDDGRAALP